MQKTLNRLFVKYRFPLMALVTALSLYSALHPRATLIGNTEDRVFHKAGCQQNSDGDNIVFTSRKDAMRAGFRPCRVCIK